ncbi:MAG: MarC family protein [Candidatus Thermoplasmatota archaeon]|nr:MarC family protein [Candidatus Thermoplasmatota archaeon]
MDNAFVISAFIAIFAIVNPISKIVLFPMLTEGFTKEERMSTLATSIYASFLLFAVFGIFGRFLFEGLGVGFTALRLTGATVLLKIGFDMLQGQLPKTKPSAEERDEATAKKMVGVFPLAMPFIAGPAAIITVMLYMAEAPGTFEGVLVLTSTAMVCLITLLFLYYAHNIFDKIGKVGVLASVRIMGMILLAISFQMFINAFRTLVTEFSVL